MTGMKDKNPRLAHPNQHRKERTTATDANPLILVQTRRSAHFSAWVKGRKKNNACLPNPQSKPQFDRTLWYNPLEIHKEVVE